MLRPDAVYKGRKVTNNRFLLRLVNTLVIFCKKGVYKKSEPQICQKLRNGEEIVQPKISRNFRNLEANILKTFVTQSDI